MLTLRRRLITGKNRNNERLWGFVCYSLLISLKFLQQSVGLCGVILWSLIASPTGLACRLRRKWNCSHVNFVGSPASFPPIVCFCVVRPQCSRVCSTWFSVLFFSSLPFSPACLWSYLDFSFISIKLAFFFCPTNQPCRCASQTTFSWTVTQHL